MRTKCHKKGLTSIPMLLLIFFASITNAATTPPTRVVIVPFVITGNGGVDAAYALRLSHIISKELDKSGVEVVRPFSPDLSQERCQRMLEE